MPLYHVTLNWYGEIIEQFTSAKSPRQALSFAADQLARVLRVSRQSVLRAFLYEEQKYKVEIAKTKEDLRHERDVACQRSKVEEGREVFDLWN